MERQVGARAKLDLNQALCLQEILDDLLDGFLVDVDLLVLQRLLNQSAIHTLHVVAQQLEAVSCLQWLQAIRPAVELGVTGEAQLGAGVGCLAQITESGDAQFLRVGLVHSQGIGVVRVGGVEPNQAFGRVKFLRPSIGFMGFVRANRVGANLKGAVEYEVVDGDMFLEMFLARQEHDQSPPCRLNFYGNSQDFYLVRVAVLNSSKLEKHLMEPILIIFIF